ncbi:DUF4112 domain-containing protein [Halalkalibaculum sp. DA3122]|uniref:DUF4112 domain-containing protein n=1 Tax=unclassified Halalkalibaculum TaxID=2964617 RepID=UPI0037545AB3
MVKKEIEFTDSVSRKSAAGRLAELLDRKFKFPGTDIRFGIDAVIGLLPGLGDWIGGVLSLYFPIHAALIGGRVSILARMFLNILVDMLIGTVPIIGELFDVAWKANIRNARLLDELEKNPSELATESKWLIWAIVVLFTFMIVAFLWLIGWVLAELVGLLL